MNTAWFTGNLPYSIPSYSCVELAGVDHIVFGNDFQPGGDDVVGAYVAALPSGRPLSALLTARVVPAFRPSISQLPPPGITGFSMSTASATKSRMRRSRRPFATAMHVCLGWASTISR